MKHWRILLISAVCLGWASMALGQRTISGGVTDADTGEPLIGANILIIGTSLGTVTDFDGKYELEVPAGAKQLEFSYTGYTPQVVEIGNRSTIDLQLSAGQTLDEVVVVGYGTQKKKDVSSAIESLSAEDVKDVPSASFEAAIQGKASGVNISSPSGTPGGAINVNIRGISSISASSQPLFIIDGIPVVSRNNSALNQNIQPVNPLADINPNDIESITILKDASAASIYGSRGANGVILITTKRGASEKTQVNVGYYKGFSNITNVPEMMGARDFVRFLNVAAENDGLEAGYFNEDFGFNPDDPGADVQTTDIYDAIFRTGQIDNADLSVQGGNDKTQFYLSGNFFNQSGIQIGQEFRRISTRLNLDHRLNEKIKLGANFAVNRSNHRRTINENDEYGVVINAQAWDPSAPVYEDDGSYANPFNYNTWWPLDNPVLIALEYKNRSLSTRLQGSLFGQYEMLPGLTFKTVGSVDINTLNEESYTPTFSNKTSIGQGIFATWEELSWQVENTLNFTRVLGDHSFHLIAGFSAQEIRAIFSDMEGAGYSTNETPSISAAANIVFASSGKRRSSLISYLGRFNYGFKSRYLATFTVRADGSSRFGENNRYGYFPSGSVAWVVSEEPFMADQGLFSELKLRGSYGITGNQEIGSDWVGTWGLDAPYNGQSGISPSQLENPDLSWEKTAQLNLGIDLGLLDSRINLAADYFIKNTTDLLLNADVSGLTGFTSVFQNVGEIENKGFEISLNTLNINSRGFSWSTTFNLALLENTVKKLFNNGEILGRNHILQEGQSASTLYMIKFLGVDPQTGDALFEDLNGDDVIDFDDRQIAGSALPDYFGGFNNTFTFKGFTLAAFLQFSGGNKIFNQSRHAYENYGQLRSGLPYGNNSRYVLDNYWREPGQQTDVPRPSLQTGQMQRFSTQFLEDGDFIRLKNLRLAYQFPEVAVQKMRLRSLTLYAQAQNLFTITGYRGFDPEVSTNTASQGALNTQQGEDFGTLGQARTISVGVNVGL
ncbi:MAG: TonB-dependent receptor [Phaeodactylibacter sp.]|nr:TonB-dependent receptor [Phaeodactylibacter sp.]